MFFLSSAEGVRFAAIAAEMTERARALGPNPLKNGSGSDQTSLPNEGSDVITD
jgi:hypothetical protein